MDCIQTNISFSSVNADQSRHVRERRQENNQASILRFLDAMFAYRSRYLVLVLTLGYKEAWWPCVTIERLRKDRDRLFNNFRSHPVLRHVHGYVWKLEYGAETGPHMHLIVFYDGQYYADGHYANAIGQYWAGLVTDRCGHYWISNCQSDPRAYAPWGNATGQVDRHDTARRTSLQNYLLHYTCKNAQHFPQQEGPACRMFGTSQPPR